MENLRVHLEWGSGLELHYFRWDLLDLGLRALPTQLGQCLGIFRSMCSSCQFLTSSGNSSSLNSVLCPYSSTFLLLSLSSNCEMFPRKSECR